MPKTSSRAITSPAGTADTMEVFAPVELSLTKMHQVVEKENGCIIWGGAVALSPADDILIRVEKAMDLDSEGQLVASVISKKVAVGSTHIVIDMPIGPTAKIRSQAMAELLKAYLESIAEDLNINIQIVFTDGSQPVGYGIGPALEAMDVMAVLQNEKDAPADLREHALILAGHILEFSPKVQSDTGYQLAKDLLSSGAAWQKFQNICEAQGGMSLPQKAPYTHEVTAYRSGKLTAIDNRRLARMAKLAGAPHDKCAGIKVHCKLDTSVREGQPLYAVFAESKGELNYALSLLENGNHIFQIEDI